MASAQAANRELWRNAQDTRVDPWEKKRTKMCQRDLPGAHLAVIWTVKEGDLERWERRDVKTGNLCYFPS